MSITDELYWNRPDIARQESKKYSCDHLEKNKYGYCIRCLYEKEFYIKSNSITISFYDSPIGKFAARRKIRELKYEGFKYLIRKEKQFDIYSCGYIVKITLSKAKDIKNENSR